MNTNNYVSADGLTKKFGKHAVLNGIDVHVGPGDVVGLLGANGAGKTTLLEVLLGLSAPTAGSAQLFGTDAPVASRKRIGYVPQTATNSSASSRASPIWISSRRSIRAGTARSSSVSWRAGASRFRSASRAFPSASGALRRVVAERATAGGRTLVALRAADEDWSELEEKLGAGARIERLGLEDIFLELHS